ncbi:cupredoxin domain-containing protein [Candidatus Nitrospira bockiana]
MKRMLGAGRILGIGGMAILLLACQQLTPGQRTAIPETSRTGKVVDVRINFASVAPADLKVDVGDEVRFINDGTLPIRVILIEAAHHAACQRGFRAAIDQEAEISPGRYASFCFDKAGTVKYMAREKGPVAGGEKVLSAQIRVEEGGATAASISEAAPEGTSASRREVEEGKTPPRITPSRPEAEAGLTLTPEEK